MADKYVYRKAVRRFWYRRFSIRRRYAIIFLIIVALGALVVVFDLLSTKKPQPKTSTAKSTSIESPLLTYQTDYFEFKDTGRWVLNKQESTSNKYVYYKFRGVQPEYQLVVYVNQVPVPLYLASSRVLPVRIVNDRILDTTNVYGHCVATYQPGELHKVKVVTIEGAKMLCDPDTMLYTVVLSEVNGDWQLNMRRSNGEPIKFVITFRDQTLNPGPDTILKIAETFKSL
jgi:hypothetical protein